MRFKLILMILSSTLLAVVMVACDSEESNKDIDPCPGWPCFKVGNEWVYSIGLDNGYGYAHWIAEGIVKRDDGKDYLQIRQEIVHYIVQEFEVIDTLNFTRNASVRTEGDSVYWYGSVCCGLRWIYNQPDILFEIIDCYEETRILWGHPLQPYPLKKIINNDTISIVDTVQDFGINPGFCGKNDNEAESISRNFGFIKGCGYRLSYIKTIEENE
jgi:hypothetical protein